MQFAGAIEPLYMLDVICKGTKPRRQENTVRMEERFRRAVPEIAVMLLQRIIADLHAFIAVFRRVSTI